MSSQRSLERPKMLGKHIRKLGKPSRSARSMRDERRTRNNRCSQSPGCGNCVVDAVSAKCKMWLD